MVTAENEQSSPTYHRFHEPIDFSYVESIHTDDIKLVWVDQNYRDDELGPLLHRIDSSVPFFDSLTQAVEYISASKDTARFFVIVSGKFCEEMIELSEHLSQIRFLFVYCSNVANYQNLKERSLKLLTICDKRSDLLHSIEKAQASAPITIASQYSMRDLKKEPAIFIWFQLLKSLLTELTNDNEEMAMRDLEEQIKQHHQNNEVQAQKVLEELDWYTPSNVISWYSCPASISNIINRALRQQNVTLLYECRHFIRDLSQALSILSQNLPPGLHVYHGCVHSREDFNKLRRTVRQRPFVSTCGYLSTSKNRHAARMFTRDTTRPPMNDEVSVMYEICIANGTDVIAADISGFSRFPEEKEVLFDVDSTFEVLEVHFDEENQWCTIRMQTSTHGRDLTDEYLRYNESELDRLSVEVLFGRLIADMGEFDKSIQYFEKIIDQESIDQIDVRINLGRAYALKGDYENANKYYDEARTLETNNNSSKIAEIMNNLGWLDNKLGDYKSAIEKYRTSLELYDNNQASPHWQIKGALHTNIAIAQTALSSFDEAERELNSSYACMLQAGLPRSHPDFSQHQMNLGKIWQSRGNYENAKHHYKEALQMRRHALPIGHLDIGEALYRLGSATGEGATGNDDYETALVYFRESLIISEKAVGEEHPTTSLVWSGIANVYLCRDEYENALIYQSKVLKLNQKIYDHKDHEDIARSLNNIGELHRRMKNYEQAFSCLTEALRMRTNVLGPDHLDTGTVHVNLAETYEDIGNYHKAAEHAEKGLKLWRRKLLPSASYMAEGEALLLRLRGRIVQNNSSNTKRKLIFGFFGVVGAFGLLFYFQALKIRKVRA